MRDNGLALIPMAAPNTPPGRLKEIVDTGDGFLYLVSMAGLTGDEIGEATPWKRVAAQARDMDRLPVCIGFGIRTARDATRAVLFSDGVVVGTAITACIMDARSTAEAKKGIRELVKGLAEAVK
jgi:tryptophan synthase alpha chain